AIQQIKQTHGDMITVSDEEILEAMKTTARLGGVFGEPAGVTASAGLKRALEKKIIKPNETALVMVTGNGLKDIQSARQAAGDPISLAPTIEALTSVIAASQV
ncbi:pyridoxal-phosphate dependent enzyme, partial [bacterium]|nr:pyridoxal-phosphate dependent enzyme [bacterium]